MQTQAHRTYLDRLPSEWDRVKVKELGGLYAGSTPRRSEPSYWEGDIPWLTPSQVTGRSDKWVRKTDEYITQEGYESTSVHVVPPGSLLVTTRATIGEVAIAGVPMTTNQGFKNVILGPQDNSLFYYYLLRFIADEMRRLSSGSTFDEISKSDFGEIIVPRPSSEEQRRIAEVLDTVDAAIQQTDAVIAKQQQVKTGLLQDLLTRGLDEQGRLRDPERQPEQFKDSPLGRIPKAWDVTTCSEVLAMSNGKAKTKSEVESETGTVPVYGGNGLTGFCSSPLVSHPVIVVGRVGEYCGSVHVSEEPAWITDNAIYASAPSSDVNLGFAAAYLSWFDLSRKSTRTGQPLMTQTAVSEVPFPRPNLSEQLRIVARVAAHDDGSVQERKYKDKLSVVKAALMQDLLTGKVRVPEAEAVVEEVIA